MSNKVFFDTNVILDIIDSNRTLHKYATEVWEKLVVEGFDIVISEDMLSTIFYINEDKKYTLEFFQFIQNRWHIVPFGDEVIKSSITISLEKNLDLENLLQCLCAKEHGCQFFITNDKKFYNCEIEILSVKNFLQFHIKAIVKSTALSKREDKKAPVNRPKELLEK